MRKMTSYLRRASAVGLALALLFSAASCSGDQVKQPFLLNAAAAQECDPDSVPPPRSAFTTENGPLTQLAAEVGRDAGTVIASGRGSTNRTVFVFEERHDSRIAQIEIALMLWRLQQGQGLRQISLEGAMAAQGDLPVQWFHEPAGGGATKGARREAALKLLREGEISAAELAALVQPEVRVRGNEVDSEYRVEPSKNNASVSYLISIAERSLTPDDIRRANSLVRAKQLEEALNVIVSSNAWTKDRYEKLYGDSISSTEESAVILRELEAKARELGIKADARQEAGLREDINFYRMASQRSCTIVKNTLAMMDAAATAPVALIIGAAHTPKVVELLKAAKLSYAVLTPLAMKDKAPGLTGEMYRRKMALGSVDPAGMLGALLDGRKKPSPVVGERWFKSKAGIYASADLLAAAAAGGGPIPSDALGAELKSLPIKIDFSTLTVTGKGALARITYKVTALVSDDDPDRTVDVWVSGWIQPPSPPDDPTSATPSSGDEFERLILLALNEDRRAAERGDKVTVTEVAQGKPVVVQLTTRTRAAFSTDLKLLQRVTHAR